MRPMFKTAFVLSLTGVFAIGSVLCCCVRNIARADTVAVAKSRACCASKHTGGQPQKAADCEHCSVSLKSAQIAQSFDLIPSLTIAFADIVFTAHTAVVYQTVWADGPPGFSSEVPLYIRSHQIRV